MKEGTLVYYLDEGQIHDGHVIDVETKQNGFVFSIDSYGECGGFCRSTTRCLRMLRKRKST